MSNNLSPPSLLNAARGFSTLFWGLITGMLLFTDAVSIQVFQFLPFPSYLMGVFIAGGGLFMLSKSGMSGRKWKKHLRGMVIMLALTAYMAPFVVWAKRLPFVNYLFAHQMALVVLVLLLLYFANALVSEAAHKINDATLRIEARGCNAVLVLVLLLPALYLIIRTVHIATVRGSSYYSEWLQIGFLLPRFVFVLLFFPVTLTLACLWKGGQVCMRRIIAMVD